MVPVWMTVSDLFEVTIDLFKVTIILRQITWKWYNIQLYLLWPTNRKSYMIYRTAPLSTTLNDPYPQYQGHVILWRWISQERYTTYRHSFKSRWRHSWKSAQVVNSHIACDPTIRQPGFDLSQQQWSLLNRFRTEQGHYGACRRKWRLTDTDLCPCGETQTMSHTVESCPLTKLNGGLSRLHSADEDAVSWLTSYGSWNAYEKKNEILIVTYTRHTQHCHFHWPWVT